MSGEAEAEQGEPTLWDVAFREGYRRAQEGTVDVDAAREAVDRAQRDLEGIIDRSGQNKDYMEGAKFAAWYMSWRLNGDEEGCVVTPFDRRRERIAGHRQDDGREQG